MLEMMKKNMIKAKLEEDEDDKGGQDPYDALFAQLGLAGSDAGKKVRPTRNVQRDCLQPLVRCYIKVATERLKTDDEIVAEEKERLEKLEADRVRRMRGNVQEASPDDGDKARNSIEQLLSILSPFWNWFQHFGHA